MSNSIQELLTSISSRDPSPQQILEVGKHVNELIRYEVLVNKNIEVFVEYVLGYKPLDFHRDFLRYQHSRKEMMILAFRGSAKTSYCNICRVIFEIILNPNIRILLAAASSAQGEDFLRGIKNHFESNQRLRELFGDYVKNAPLWTTTSITVNRKTSMAKEPTVMVVGAGTALPGRHYDMLICDDLVIADNAATDGQRKKISDYYYSSLIPTLEPNGKLFILGTRWHEQDLYEWLQNEDMKDNTLIMGVLDENEQSRWEEQFPTEKMLKIRKANLNAFTMQYMCVGGTGSAGFFTEHMFEYVESLPPNLIIWQGIDFAVGQKDHNDFFAHATIGIDRVAKEVYLINAFKRKITFPNQVNIIRHEFKKYDQGVMRVVAEANGQQLGLLQQIQKDIPDIPLQAKYNQLDKLAKAQQVSVLLAHKPLKVLRSQSDFVTLMLGFPNILGSKDVFDAFELAYSQSLRGARKSSRNDDIYNKMI